MNEVVSHLLLQIEFFLLETGQLRRLVLNGDLVDTELSHGRFVLPHDLAEFHFQIVDLRLNVAALPVGAEVALLGFTAKPLRLLELRLRFDELLFGVLSSFDGRRPGKL